MRAELADFDAVQEWVDSIAAHQWSDSEYAALDAAPADPVAQVDLAAGEFFRSIWRRRLAAAQGDFAYVARQMRKAGVPLDLAIAILLTPGPQRAATMRESDGPFGADDGRASSPAHLVAGRALQGRTARAA
jgi:hypothetical protein